MAQMARDSNGKKNKCLAWAMGGGRASGNGLLGGLSASRLTFPVIDQCVLECTSGDLTSSSSFRWINSREWAQL